MPPDLSSKFALVSQHINAGRNEQARQILQRILQQYPNHPDANNGMAVTLVGLGQVQQALYFAERAAKAAPRDGFVLNTYGSALTQLGRPKEAIPILEQAAALAPDFAALRVNLANALWACDRCVDAMPRLEAARALAPDDPETGASLIVKNMLLARSDLAREIGREYLGRIPGHPSLMRAYAVAIVNTPGSEGAEVFEAHRAFGLAMEQAASAAARTHANTRDPERRLRVGLLSPDFRNHSVPYFIEPLLEHLDRASHWIACYSAFAHDDAVTKRFKARADAWRQIELMNDAAAADKIAADQIDILIDLAGLTTGHRLGAFQLRPAPVQVTYCGYPSSLGMSAIGHRIVDSLTDPPGAERFATEHLTRIDPCFLCYRPSEDAPEVAPPPSRTRGYVTFGSFNATSKLNDPWFRVWAAILNRVPGSRLVLKAVQLNDASLRESLHTRLGSLGLARDRVTLLGVTKTTREHLELYNTIDVGLDTYPYHGTTTTCEALWMGVPVISREGIAHAGRVGVSLLTCVGLHELIAKSDAEYVEKAVALATDEGRRAAWRGAGVDGASASIRAMMQRSPLLDGPAFAARFAGALRGMWRDWCAGTSGSGTGARP